jgi:uncharacterized protein YbjQ (UPF0145 family)
MFEIGTGLALLLIAYFLGGWEIKRHLRDLRDREQALRNIHVFASEQVAPQDSQYHSYLVCGTVVVSLDYFRRFVESIVQLFGGRISASDDLLDRARREAMVRLKQQAAHLGAKRIFNVKIQTAHITSNREDGIGSFEIIAYGTAMVP